MRIAGGFASRSYEIPVRDGSVDLVFAFQAAHHFRAHGRTLREIRRVLAPGGRCVFMHEPTAEFPFYPLAKWRAVLAGGGDPEDVIRSREFVQLARSTGFQVRVIEDESVRGRGAAGVLYYVVLRRARWLRSVLPCTRHFVLEKPSTQTRAVEHARDQVSAPRGAESPRAGHCPSP